MEGKFFLAALLGWGAETAPARKALAHGPLNLLQVEGGGQSLDSSYALAAVPLLDANVDLGGRRSFVLLVVGAKIEGVALLKVEDLAGR